MNVIKKSCFAGLGLGLILLVSACMPVFLYQKDYSFYDADFALSANSVLRTDGFYVFEGMAGQQVISLIRRKCMRCISSINPVRSIFY